MTNLKFLREEIEKIGEKKEEGSISDKSPHRSRHTMSQEKEDAIVLSMTQ